MTNQETYLIHPKRKTKIKKFIKVQKQHGIHRAIISQIFKTKQKITWESIFRETTTSERYWKTRAFVVLLKKYRQKIPKRLTLRRRLRRQYHPMRQIMSKKVFLTVTRTTRALFELQKVAEVQKETLHEVKTEQVQLTRIPVDTK